jgi:UDP-N-acetylglucosamine 2-epimerase (non-hydrolysing)
MKIAPIYKEMKKYSDKFEPLIIHTAQHYDDEMSKVFFEDLTLSKPDINLGVGSASHAVQTAKIMIEFEKVRLVKRPDLIIVVGDVNSTLACSNVSSKLYIPVAHVEAGLRVSIALCLRKLTE